MRAPHLLTVVLEDYFQAAAFRSLIDRTHWYRFESRLDATTDRLLSLLSTHNSRATFFALGWVADRMPELVRRVADAGHEVADCGFLPLDVPFPSADEFRENVRCGRQAVEAAAGRSVRGHRSANWLPFDETEALDLLALEGYAYDSSLRPHGFATASRRQRARPFVHSAGGAHLLELPISADSWGPLLVPRATCGSFDSQRRSARQSVATPGRDATTDRVPIITCVHAWELDPEQPKLTASALTRFRHYRHLDTMAQRLGELLQSAPSEAIATWMSLETVAPRVGHAVATRAPDVADAPIVSTGRAAAPTTRLSVVIPCFNESAGLGYLERTLAHVAEAMSPQHELEYVFVDDGSTDETWTQLQERFGPRADCVLVRHPINRGVAGAIRSGVMAARENIVASIDADCTYDPHELPGMVALLADDVALVTASPYHPRGGVRNVAAWRLLLSRGLSSIYRRLLTNRLHTITSCCRIYRRDVVLSVPMAYGDYRGIAEWLIRIDLAGGRIVEYPTVLHARVLGTSKMKVVRSILGHLQLMLNMLRLRFGARDRLARASSVDAPASQWPAADSAPA